MSGTPLVSQNWKLLSCPTVVEAGYPTRETDGAESRLTSTMGFPVFIMLYFYAGN